MEIMLELLVSFFGQYGWQLALIALVGIILLGVLKYADVFKRVEKEKRKPIYFAISVGFSIIASIIYLAIVGQLDINYIVAISMAVYMLNQTMYSIYETTKLRDLVAKILDIIVSYLKSKSK